MNIYALLISRVEGVRNGVDGIKGGRDDEQVSFDFTPPYVTFINDMNEWDEEDRHRLRSQSDVEPLIKPDDNDDDDHNDDVDEVFKPAISPFKRIHVCFPSAI